MFNYDSGGVARRVKGRETDEQAVVPIFPKPAFAPTFVKADDLRGAGFARHFYIVDGEPRATCSSRAIDYFIHGIAHNSDMLVRKTEAGDYWTLRIPRQMRHERLSGCKT